MAMTTLPANDGVLAAFRQATNVVEIRDAHGTIIGYFAPVSAERAHLYGVQRPSGEETGAEGSEIERLKATANPGKTTREVFERLKTLTDDPALQADLQRHIDELTERDRCASS